MGDMIERIARTLAEQEMLDRYGSPSALRGNHWAMSLHMLTKQDRFQRRAAAILTAMRDPTPMMLSSVAPRTDPASAADYDLAAQAAKITAGSEHLDAPAILAELARDWRNMIDAALTPAADTPPAARPDR